MTPTRDEAEQMAAVLSAMRLAVVGAPDPVTALEVVALLLDEAPPSAPDDTAGVALLVRLLRERRLQASVTAEGDPQEPAA